MIIDESYAIKPGRLRGFTMRPADRYFVLAIRRDQYDPRYDRCLLRLWVGPDQFHSRFGRQSWERDYTYRIDLLPVTRGDT